MGQSGKDGCGERKLDFGYVWKVEATGFAGILFIGHEQEKGVNKDSSVYSLEEL